MTCENCLDRKQIRDRAAEERLRKRIAELGMSCAYPRGGIEVMKPCVCTLAPPAVS